VGRSGSRRKHVGQPSRRSKTYWSNEALRNTSPPRSYAKDRMNSFASASENTMNFSRADGVAILTIHPVFWLRRFGSVLSQAMSIVTGNSLSVCELAPHRRKRGRHPLKPPGVKKLRAILISKRFANFWTSYLLMNWRHLNRRHWNRQVLFCLGDTSDPNLGVISSSSKNIAK